MNSQGTRTKGRLFGSAKYLSVVVELRKPVSETLLVIFLSIARNKPPVPPSPRWQSSPALPPGTPSRLQEAPPLPSPKRP
ncbi:hypothetical protein B0H10DRAFT_2063600 [Mycena sp. CBHHK59/15]|nr:hypothetical protein B0H10DRAFT_2119573 [Mycena sp. CBHHK59/15]KAJ6609580.1 hypothetical protein B0H10DRAFT_2063600 [Mycena sp. CBHHK59/15]